MIACTLFPVAGGGDELLLPPPPQAASTPNTGRTARAHNPRDTTLINAVLTATPPSSRPPEPAAEHMRGSDTRACSHSFARLAPATEDSTDAARRGHLY